MEWSLSTHHTAPTIKVGRSVRQDDGTGGAYTALIRREGIVHRSILFLICCLLLKHLAAGNICYHLFMPCKGTKKPPSSTTTYLYSPILCLIPLTDSPKSLAEEYPSRKRQTKTKAKNKAGISSPYAYTNRLCETAHPSSKQHLQYGKHSTFSAPRSTLQCQSFSAVESKLSTAEKLAFQKKKVSVPPLVCSLSKEYELPYRCRSFFLRAMSVPLGTS